MVTVRCILCRRQCRNWMLPRNFPWRPCRSTWSAYVLVIAHPAIRIFSLISLCYYTLMGGEKLRSELVPSLRWSAPISVHITDRRAIRGSQALRRPTCRFIRADFQFRRISAIKVGNAVLWVLELLALVPIGWAKNSAAYNPRCCLDACSVHKSISYSFNLFFVRRCLSVVLRKIDPRL